MKIKDTKKLVANGEFQPFKITVESEGEAAMIAALLGKTTDTDDIAFGLEKQLGYKAYRAIADRVTSDKVYPMFNVNLEKA